MVAASAIVANPLPTDGVAAKLTPSQQNKLKQMWRQFYDLVDEAPIYGADGMPNSDDANGADGGGLKLKRSKTASSSNSGGDPTKGIPKDDAAKEAARTEADMKESKAALEKYGSRKFLDTFWKFIIFENVDDQMLRFLRARKWDPTPAVAMLAACMKWRIESGVEDIITKGEEGYQNGDEPGFLNQLEWRKSYVFGTDRCGRPINYIHAKVHRSKDQPPKALEEFTFYNMEMARCLIPYGSYKLTLIFDLTGFGLGNMDWHIVMVIVKCLESYYPESLNCILIHNAPWVFHGIWKILAPLLDPVVRAKVQLTKNLEDLSVHIDPRHIIKELGGESEVDWEYVPVKKGENKTMQDTETRDQKQQERNGLIEKFEELNRKWLDEEDEEEDSNDEVTERKKSDLTKARDLVILKMRQQYWELDPYIRGRSCYHRNGNVVGNGLITWQYPGLAPEGEWEIQGWNGSIEIIEKECKRLERELKGTGYEAMV